MGSSKSVANATAAVVAASKQCMELTEESKLVGVDYSQLSAVQVWATLLPSLASSLFLCLFLSHTHTRLVSHTNPLYLSHSFSLSVCIDHNKLFFNLKVIHLNFTRDYIFQAPWFVIDSNWFNLYFCKLCNNSRSSVLIWRCKLK